MTSHPEVGDNAAKAPADYLRQTHRNKGLGGWRALYLELLQTPQLRNYSSILEIGAGSPDFLASSPAPLRVAVDVSDRYAADFETQGVEFAVRNLENEDLSGLGQFDVAVCSDVFEHLLRPAGALAALRAVLEPDGILISHVPNEYRLGPTLRIMLGLQEGLYFHTRESEWTDPHIRRFTDLGYRRFLRQCFQWNAKVTQLRYGRPARALHRLGLKVPLCLEGGPTYISTNSREKYDVILEAANSR